MKLVFLILALVSVAWPAAASKIIGNGGDVSVCPNRSPKVQLLDFVESRVLRKQTIKLWNPPGREYLDKLAHVNAKIDRRFPELGSVIAREIINFEEKNVKENDIELEDINDSYHKLRLPGCHVEQIANQSTPMFEDDPWFLINANLWNQLEEFDKAGLVLHEVLYRVGLRHGLEHSIGVRYLTSLFFQENLNKVTDQQWVQAFMHSRIKHFETAGLKMPLFKGEEKICEVVPGTFDCAGGDAEFKPALVIFNPDRSLSQVNFEGVGAQPFEFKFGKDYRAILTTEKVSFDVLNGKSRFISEGRIYIRSVKSVDTALADVRGVFDPVSGKFRGDYKFVRPDLTTELRWNEFDGNLSELYDKRPAWNQSAGRDEP